MRLPSPKIAAPVLVLRRERFLVAVLCLALLIVVGGALLVVRSRGGLGHVGVPAAAPAPGAAGPQLPGRLPAPTQPGQYSLDDFQITVPPGWERRKDYEDPGPGTKLFLVGPVVGASNLVLGIDVYPLRSGTTLEQFVNQYSVKQWNLALLTNRPATLCNQPARILALSESGLDKLYLLTVWREKGFAIGMIGPAGHSTKTTPLFRQVVDTFQLYK
jgi:hypothetical protein